MEFSYNEKQKLPALAWCAQVTLGERKVTVYHGSGVEVTAHRFFEGAWDGPLNGSQGDATVMCGSGAWLENGAARFAGSTDRLVPLYSVRKKDVLYISNSPIFAIQAAGDSPDDAHPFYNYDLIKGWRRGLYYPASEIPLSSGVMNVHFASILTINNEGELSFDLYPLCKEPDDFRGLHALLRDSMKRLFENAGDARRTTAYRPLAAISKGYDSTATAVLARQAGCENAYSFIDEKVPDPRSDSGKENAERLGMVCEEYSRWAYLGMSGEREAEFCLTPVAVPKTLMALSGQLKGRLIVGANAGDLIWQADNSRLIDHMATPWSRYMSGLAQIEYRLREGYFVMSGAAIGSRHNRAIHRIDVSAEMDPWRVGGEYDRPIPRRLAEEAGLPRESFGQVKAGTGHAAFHKDNNFSVSARADYQKYLDGRTTGSVMISKLKVRALNLWWKLAAQDKKKAVRSTPWRRRFPFLFINYPKRVTYTYMFTFQWGFSKLKGSYEINQQ